jgi:hypothetical protein
MFGKFRVFSNCVLYNGSESDVGRIGLNIQKEFENLLKTSPLNTTSSHKSGMELETKPKNENVYQNDETSI